MAIRWRAQDTPSWGTSALTGQAAVVVISMAHYNAVKQDPQIPQSILRCVGPRQAKRGIGAADSQSCHQGARLRTRLLILNRGVFSERERAPRNIASLAARA